jgi:hypothetical protein
MTDKVFCFGSLWLLLVLSLVGAGIVGCLGQPSGCGLERQEAEKGIKHRQQPNQPSEQSNIGTSLFDATTTYKHPNNEIEKAYQRKIQGA